MALSDKPTSALSVESSLAQAIRTRLNDEGRLPCAQAFIIAAEHNLEPLAVGQAADALSVRLTRCQLGLFGYPGHAKGWDALPADLPIAPELEAALRAAGDEAGISCRTLWELAARFGVSRLVIGYVAERLGFKVKACQLGAF